MIEMKHTKRTDQRIDNLRAICIILVVLAHSIIIYNGKWGSYAAGQSSEILKYVCNFIYIFHMPLFFSLSGYLAFYSYKSINLKKLVTKKAVRLLIPFLCVGLLWMIPIRFLAHYPNYNGVFDAIVKLFTGSDAGHLWFLPTLFFIFLLHYLIIKYIKNKALCFIVILFMFFIGRFLPLYIGKTFVNMIWFHLGFIINESCFVDKKGHMPFVAILFLLTVALYFLLPQEIPLYKYFIVIIEGLASTAAIALCYQLASEKRYTLLSQIAILSFGIYLFHSPLIYLVFDNYPNINPYLMLLMNFVGLGTIATLISFLVSKSHFRFIMGLPCQKTRN